MSSFSLHKLPFWLHSLIEVTPSIVFTTNPASQLYGPNIISDLNSPVTTPKPGAEAIIRQYGVLLFVSVLISTIFAIRRVDITSRQVAAALTIYHLAPIVRAASRIWSGETAWRPDDMGGPWAHLGVHVICLFALGSLALGLWRDQHETKVPFRMD
jgi:hypothetical protein